MPFIHDPFGTVPIKQIDGQEYRFRQQPERRMSFDQEVQKVWTHVPLNFGLNLNGRDIRESFKLLMFSTNRLLGTGSTHLHLLHMTQDIVSVFLTGLL